MNSPSYPDITLSQYKQWFYELDLKHAADITLFSKDLVRFIVYDISEIVQWTIGLNIFDNDSLLELYKLATQYGALSCMECLHEAMF